jgi:Spy/CpxP family protein refolding chaperone
VPSNRFFTAAFIAAAIALPTAAFAQAPPAPPAPQTGAPAAPGAYRHHGGGWQRMLRNLNLTPQQQQQVKDAIAQTRQANQNADPQTRRANNQKLRQTIEAILTPAQRAQLQEERERFRQQNENGGAAPAPAATPLAR